MSAPQAAARVAAIVGVVALAIGVGVLSVTALERAGGTGATGTAAPVPTFTFSDRTPSSPSPMPTGSAAPAASADVGVAAERFIAIQGAQIWRATAGNCDPAQEVAPTVEYSADSGATWTDVTPPNARQVLGVATFGEGDGEVLAATGDACDPTALRTYTAGRAWESYPDVLAASSYVSPTDRSSVIVAGAAVAAPCADARSVRSSRGQAGLICGDTAYLLEGGQWSALTTDAAALDAESGTIIVAHTDVDACADGVAVTRFTGAAGADVGCVSEVDTGVPAALSVLGADLAYWSGGTVRGLG